MSLTDKPVLFGSFPNSNPLEDKPIFTRESDRENAFVCWLIKAIAYIAWAVFWTLFFAKNGLINAIMLSVMASLD